METEFYWNGSIVGHSHHMKIDGEEIDLGLNPFASSREESKLRIIEILKRDYNIDYNVDDITFEWGGGIIKNDKISVNFLKNMVYMLKT